MGNDTDHDVTHSRDPTDFVMEWPRDFEVLVTISKITPNQATISYKESDRHVRKTQFYRRSSNCVFQFSSQRTCIVYRSQRKRKRLCGTYESVSMHGGGGQNSARASLHRVMIR
jgi:hypothetical protein